MERLAPRAASSTQDRERLTEVERLANQQTEHSRILKALDLARDPAECAPDSGQGRLLAAEHNPYPARFGAATTDPDLPVPALPDEQRLDLTHAAGLRHRRRGQPGPGRRRQHRRRAHLGACRRRGRAGAPDSELDREARARGANLYLPEGIVNMLPAAVTEHGSAWGCRRSRRRCRSAFICATDGTLADIEIRPTLIRATRLTYAEAETRLMSRRSRARRRRRALSRPSQGQRRRRHRPARGQRPRGRRRGRDPPHRSPWLPRPGHRSDADGRRGRGPLFCGERACRSPMPRSRRRSSSKARGDGGHVRLPAPVQAVAHQRRAGLRTSAWARPLCPRHQPAAPLCGPAGAPADPRPAARRRTGDRRADQRPRRRGRSIRHRRAPHRAPVQSALEAGLFERAPRVGRARPWWSSSASARPPSSSPSWRWRPRSAPSRTWRSISVRPARSFGSSGRISMIPMKPISAAARVVRMILRSTFQEV
jgi:hypothetical protein